MTRNADSLYTELPLRRGDEYTPLIVEISWVRTLTILRAC